MADSTVAPSIGSEQSGEFLKSFKKSPFFTHNFFSQHLKSSMLGVITMTWKIKWVVPKALKASLTAMTLFSNFFQKRFSKNVKYTI